MMAALGMFVFQLDTLPYHELQRRSAWRHAANQRLGARDALQFLGPGEETITLSGQAMAELMDGEASLATLRAMADAGEAYPLVDGGGTVFGAFVIGAVDERRAHFFADGKARAIDFGIDLVRAPDDR